MYLSCKRLQSKGFTLIELLTVIAIIGILAAILIPVVGAVRGSARTAKCISNMREITTAVILYADENDRFPAVGSLSIDVENPEDWIYWRDTRNMRLRDSPIAPYVGGHVSKELLRCPEDDDDELDQRDYGFSYSMNGRIAGNTNLLNLAGSTNGRLENIPNPSRTAVIIDEQSPDDGHYVPNPANLVADRHQGKGTIGFADGHVELHTDEHAKAEMFFHPFQEPISR